MWHHTQGGSEGPLVSNPAEDFVKSFFRPLLSKGFKEWMTRLNACHDQYLQYTLRESHLLLGASVHCPNISRGAICLNRVSIQKNALKKNNWKITLGESCSYHVTECHFQFKTIFQYCFWALQKIPQVLLLFAFFSISKWRNFGQLWNDPLIFQTGALFKHAHYWYRAFFAAHFRDAHFRSAHFWHSALIFLINTEEMLFCRLGKEAFELSTNRKTADTRSLGFFSGKTGIPSPKGVFPPQAEF